MSTESACPVYVVPLLQQRGTCDWGDCDEPAFAIRWDYEHGWLPVCKTHEKEA